MTTPASEKRAIIPTPADIEAAQESELKISDMLAKKKSRTKYTLTNNRGTTIELSESMIKILAEALRGMARGNAIMLTSIEAEVTTQQASELLNVSRPYLVGLLEQGKIPFRLVGRYRRIKYQDIVDYQVRLSHRRKKAMDELVSQAQDLDLGY